MRNTLGILISDSRTSLGMSRETLAEKLGISTRHLAALESGAKFPSYKLLHKIVRYLNITAEHIFFPETGRTTDEQLELIRLAHMCSNGDKAKLVIALLRAVLCC